MNASTNEDYTSLITQPANESSENISTPNATLEGEDALLTQGWDDHGLFKDDPKALKLFDKIEEERNHHLVGKTE